MILERERKGEEEGEKEREREMICCSTYLCIHWLILVGALTRDGTHNLGVLRGCSNQLTCPARAIYAYFCRSLKYCHCYTTQNNTGYWHLRQSLSDI